MNSKRYFDSINKHIPRAKTLRALMVLDRRARSYLKTCSADSKDTLAKERYNKTMGMINEKRSEISNN
jgi:hypothetical protein